jgi:membrane fusion protein (multidrug efflux system)
VGVLESGIPSLSAGNSAEVEFSALPGERFTARIESVNPLVDRENGGMGRVTLVMPNPGQRILPGMYADARLDAEALPDRILVPREAILDRNSGGERRQIVFMARRLNERGEGIAEWRYVTTGARNERVIEIVAHEETFMLEPGEVVLVDGHHYLTHDIPVRLVENVYLAGGRPGR